MINAALATLVFMLEEDEQEASEKGEDADARLRENALDMILYKDLAAAMMKC